MICVAINGFGRIGRMFFRLAHKDKSIKIVAINDLSKPQILAHLLMFDSTHGTFEATAQANKSHMIVDKTKIPIFAEKDPSNLPWKGLKVDVVLESTGHFTNPFDAQAHLKAGAKKVLVSAPLKCDEDCKVQNVTIIHGVNDKDYKKKKHHIVSNASCTSNCVAPVLKVIEENFGIKNCFFSTIHAYTSTQHIVDSPGKDFRRSRAAAVNIVPSSTGADKAVVIAMPKLKGKIKGMAFRVPVINGSVTDFTIEVKKDVNVEKINAAFRKASAGKLKNVLDYTELPLVSSDIIGNPYSSIIDGKLRKVQGKRTIKVVSWYDNEWGYSNRLIDLAKSI